MDYQSSPYVYDPANNARLEELKAKRDADPESLTQEERRELHWLVQSRTNYFLKGLRG